MQDLFSQREQLLCNNSAYTYSSILIKHIYSTSLGRLFCLLSKLKPVKKWVQDLGQWYIHIPKSCFWGSHCLGWSVLSTAYIPNIPSKDYLNKSYCHLIENVMNFLRLVTTKWLLYCGKYFSLIVRAWIETVKLTSNIGLNR